jgi:hypothetical protein
LAALKVALSVVACAPLADPTIELSIDGPLW